MITAIFIDTVKYVLILESNVREPTDLKIKITVGKLEANFEKHQDLLLVDEHSIQTKLLSLSSPMQ